jgi:hypothetical protein
MAAISIQSPSINAASQARPKSNTGKLILTLNRH